MANLIPTPAMCEWIDVIPQKYANKVTKHIDNCNANTSMLNPMLNINAMEELKYNIINEWIIDYCEPFKLKIYSNEVIGCCVTKLLEKMRTEEHLLFTYVFRNPTGFWYTILGKNRAKTTEMPLILENRHRELLKNTNHIQ